jgi:hypothetical protein
MPHLGYLLLDTITSTLINVNIYITRDKEGLHCHLESGKFPRLDEEKRY